MSSFGFQNALSLRSKGGWKSDDGWETQMTTHQNFLFEVKEVELGR